MRGKQERQNERSGTGRFQTLSDSRHTLGDVSVWVLPYRASAAPSPEGESVDLRADLKAQVLKVGAASCEEVGG